MRKYAGSWMIKVLLAAIVIVFIFWGVGNFKSRKDAQVASVNGEVISVEEYQKAYNNMIENYRRQFGSNIDEQMLKQLRLGRQTVDQLVNQRLLIQEAEKLGIKVTNLELAERIKQTPAFQDNGTFDKKRYTTLLSQNRLSVEEFEQGTKQQMTINKLQEFIMSGAKISDDELRGWYNYENQMVKIEYLLAKPDSYNDLKLADDDIKKYYDSNKEKYRTEPKVKVQYLSFEPKDFVAKVTVNDDEVSDYYDSHPDEFHKEKTVEARHILFKLEKDVDQETQQKVKTKALDVLKMAREGKDFAELAKTYSEGPSKSQGGSLGEFSRDKMVKPFADAAFSLKEGEISDLVKTQFGWHIIKVEKVNPERTEPLEKAKPKIRAELINARSKSFAYERAEEVYGLLFNGEDLSKVANDQKLSIKKTDFFTRQGPGKQIEDPAQFASAAFELELMDISEVKELGETFYIIQPIKKVESKVPDLQEVKSQVEKDLLAQKQSELAEKDAQGIIEALKKDDNFHEVAKKFGFDVKETAFFKREGEIPNIGYEREISAKAFELGKKGNISQEVLQGSQGFYVIRLKERKESDPEAFEKQKTEIREKLLQQKRYDTFNTFIADLKKHSQIKIHEKYIN